MAEDLAVKKHGRRPTISLLIWLRLARIVQSLDQLASEHLRTWGLSSAQFDVLVQVGMAEGLTQQDLAEVLLVTKGNVCQLLDRMERDELIRRIPAGRSNRLFLTSGGRKLFDEAVPAHEATMDTLFAFMPAADRSQLVALLRRLSHSLKERKARGDTP